MEDQEFRNPRDWFFGAGFPGNGAHVVMNPREVWIVLRHPNQPPEVVGHMVDVPKEFREGLLRLCRQISAGEHAEWAADFMARQTPGGMGTVPEGKAVAFKVAGTESDYYRFYEAGKPIPFPHQDGGILLSEGACVQRRFCTERDGLGGTIEDRGTTVYTNRGGKIVAETTFDK
jgi:hypothetical protein